MEETPTVETRTDQPYVAIPVSVRMEDLGPVVPPLTGRVFDWLSERGMSPAGPPFWRYVVIDMDAELEIETGFPVASMVEGDEQIQAGVLPAGDYATVVHTGHPDTLVTATRGLLDWAQKENLEWTPMEEPGAAGSRSISVILPRCRTWISGRPDWLSGCAIGAYGSEFGCSVSDHCRRLVMRRICMKLSTLAYSCKWECGPE